MSMDSWTAEFYPVRADDCPREGAVAHSIKKWQGLLAENLQKHGLRWTGDGIREYADDCPTGPEMFINGLSCALCHHYLDCESCPLYVVRGEVSCDAARGDETDTPWNLRAINQRIMILWLERAALYEKGELQPIADCAPADKPDSAE